MYDINHIHEPEYKHVRVIWACNNNNNNNK